ncbi:kinase-like domain-containing protein [Bipolaris maydis]|uniref:kinase-like domain-containing protein n=1 Tax=Cochliobolus heterostrophus TaxID=5016 RepID=UPI0024D31D52|nr:kinase-like domain-containing protein [Bipolaris maydis]
MRWPHGAEPIAKIGQKKGKKNIYPLFMEPDIPLYPWTAADSARARAEKRLPLNPFPPDYVPKMGHPPLEDNPLNQGHSIDELSKNDRLKTEWLAAPGPIELQAHEWRGGRCLGKGSDGITGLLLTHNHANCIKQRVVVKEVRPENNGWRDPIEWRNQLPREISTHLQIEEAREAVNGVGFENIVQCYGYHLDVQNCYYRLYLEYCPGRDVHNSLQKHFNDMGKHKYGSSESFESSQNSQAIEKKSLLLLTERFVAWLMLQLVKACYVLRTGYPIAQHNQGIRRGWKPITHCDIKLNNIFVKPPEFRPAEGQPEDYPTLVIGDFGRSFTNMDPSHSLTGDNLPDGPISISRNRDNPHAYEQQNVIYDENGTPIPLSEWTDVWQIGHMGYNLIMNGTEDQHGPLRLVPRDEDDDGDDDDDNDKNIGYFADKRNPGPTNTDTSQPFDDARQFPTCVNYSAGLNNLIANCLNWDPQQRPTLLDIYRRATELLSNCPDTVESRRVEPFVIHREDHYKQGAKFPDEDVDDSHVFSNSSLTAKKPT